MHFENVDVPLLQLTGVLSGRQKGILCDALSPDVMSILADV